MVPLRLLTAEDLAEALRISRYRAYELLRDGELPAVRVGRLVRVREDDLAAFIERRREPAAEGGER